MINLKKIIKDKYNLYKCSYVFCGSWLIRNSCFEFGVPVITHNRFDLQMPEYESIVEGLTGTFFDYETPLDNLVDILEYWLFKMGKEDANSNSYKIIDDDYNPYVQNQIFD
jgi:1,2-diacylglycerol 3-alpha-glucosyltransferase